MKVRTMEWSEGTEWKKGHSWNVRRRQWVTASVKACWGGSLPSEECCYELGETNVQVRKKGDQNPNGTTWRTCGSVAHTLRPIWTRQKKSMRRSCRSGKSSRTQRNRNRTRRSSRRGTW